MYNSIGTFLLDERFGENEKWVGLWSIDYRLRSEITSSGSKRPKSEGSTNQYPDRLTPNSAQHTESEVLHALFNVLHKLLAIYLIDMNLISKS